jgi:hypothetical protein
VKDYKTKVDIMKVQNEVSLNQFIDWFKGTQYENDFSYEGYELLYDVLNELVDENGFSPYGDDIVAIHCDWSEYTEQELINEYGKEDLESTLEYLNENTNCYHSINIYIVATNF